MVKENSGFGTKAIHGGRMKDTQYGALTMPIYQTSTFEFDCCEQGGRRFAGDPQSAKMLDLIFRNRVYDIGMIWNFGKVRDILVKSGDDIKTAAGTVSSDIKSAYETILDDIDAFVTDMKDYK